VGGAPTWLAVVSIKSHVLGHQRAGVTYEIGHVVNQALVSGRPRGLSTTMRSCTSVHHKHLRQAQPLARGLGAVRSQPCHGAVAVDGHEHVVRFAVDVQHRWALLRLVLKPAAAVLLFGQRAHGRERRPVVGST
jgi:hypothetical protein